MEVFWAYVLGVCTGVFLLMTVVLWDLYKNNDCRLCGGRLHADDDDERNEMPRTLDDDIAEIAAKLVKKALARLEKSESCKTRPLTLRVASVKMFSWSFVADVYQHDGVNHWAFSAKTVGPNARTHAHWQILVKMFTRVVLASGYPNGRPLPDPPPPTVPVSSQITYRWMWHDDGSPVDPQLTEMLRRMSIRELN